MDIEKVFRTSVFGGFRKIDVLSYVEALKKTMEELKAELAGKDEKIEELNLNAEKLAAECGPLKAEHESYLAQAETLAALREENDELSRRVAELQSAADRYEDEKNVFLENEEKLRAAKFQLGAAFLDARKYSDEIVAAANGRAAEITGEISGEIGEQARHISRLSAEIDGIAEDFEKALRELRANVVALAKKMNLSASELSKRRNAPPFVPDISIRIDETETLSRAAPDGVQQSVLQFNTPKEG